MNQAIRVISKRRGAVNCPDKPMLERITLLHSNDMHGDFLAEVKSRDGCLIGGLALLSGYINRVRTENENVLYVISGDMVQGSLIDSEFKGISTIEIMNYLAPDVVTLGNHELDYGLTHLLFMEKIATFPIVNANLYIRKYNKRLMRPHVIIRCGGLNVLFIGVITEEVLMSLRQERQIGSFISLEEAGQEIGKICNAFKNEDVDLTIILTHIGYENDLKLARMLDPRWGVDIIIGGHSHTVLRQPAKENGILIAQAGIGTDQIGRFDLVIDEASNSIREWNWQLVPIDNSHCRPDKELQEYIDSYQDVIDQKYGKIICRFAQKLLHPKREEETPLGNLFADILAERCNADMALLSSGSIRGNELGPIVTLGDVRRIFPYDGPLHKVKVTGGQLKTALELIMKPENRNSEGNCYQVSRDVRAEYNDVERRIVSFSLHGHQISDESSYSLALQDYSFHNAAKIFGLDQEELEKEGNHKTISTSCRDIIEEYLIAHQNIVSHIEGRIKINRW